MFSELANKLKETSTAIGSIAAIIATVGGCILYVENNFANAGDVKSLIRNQTQQLEMVQRGQTQNYMFQLDYYDQQIRKLEFEKSRASEILLDPQTTRTQRAYTRRPEDIQTEINELKSRRDLVRNSIININPQK